MGLDPKPFEAFLDREQILDREADRMTYDADGVTLEKFIPGLVVLPRSAEEVAAIVRHCSTHKIPFVGRGAGTGLSGGALSGSADAVLIVMTRMNRIIEINADEAWAIVEPGVVNAHLSRAVKQHGLHFAPDPSSGTASTIGGNISENAGGPHCLKYGATAEHILGVEVVLTNGEIVWLDSHSTAAPLLSVFIGSEGTLGIVTKAKAKLTQNPETTETMLVEFQTPADAARTVANIITSGIVPAALEMIDAEVLGALEAAFNLGLPRDAGALLLIELDGRRHSMPRLVQRVIAIAEREGAKSVRVAKNAAERDGLWKARKRAFGALGRISPSYYTQDGVIPRHTLPEVLEEIYAIGKRYGLRIANIFHAGDGNLHPAILYNERDPAQVDAVLAASNEILKICIARGGSITGEHGVGIEKQEALGWQFSGQDVKIMERVRAVFNKDGLLNPGKFLPTDHSCREVAPKHRKVAM